MNRLLLALAALVLLVTPSTAQVHKNGDAEKAARLWRQFAEQGDPIAQNKLGEFYDEGFGVAQNYAEAMKCYRLAAEQEFAEAQRNVGFMYDNGRGVPQDYTQAAKWYRFAAQQGDTQAQHNLGIMYERGIGVPQDFVQAHMWLQMALAGGDIDAEWDRNEVAKRMTPAEVSAAQRMAREWLEEHRR